jgi:hypothetical protein
MTTCGTSRLDLYGASLNDINSLVNRICTVFVSIPHNEQKNFLRLGLCTEFTSNQLMYVWLFCLSVSLVRGSGERDGTSS